MLHLIELVTSCAVQQIISLPSIKGSWGKWLVNGQWSCFLQYVSFIFLMFNFRLVCKGYWGCKRWICHQWGLQCCDGKILHAKSPLRRKRKMCLCCVWRKAGEMTTQYCWLTWTAFGWFCFFHDRLVYLSLWPFNYSDSIYEKKVVL